ncbi:phage tail protein [Yersinia aldovae]|uniref:phage tail protein n=1 Tax=Yersinia aldovae TaxID=29483 RepID=UPI0011A3DC13|nr:phage tail protein [Yersinia aldovae]
MTAKYFALLTNLGAAKLANAAALGTPLQITQMAVGDGGGILPTPNPAQTQLIGEKRRAALNSLSIDEANGSQIIAEQVIPETDGGWWIREVGLFDKDGILIAIANCPDTYKPQLQEGSGRTQTVRMVLIVSSTDAITLKIDPSVVLATRKYVDDKVIEVKTYADDLLAEHVKSRNHPDASKTEKGFVKLSSAITSDSEVLAATSKAVKTVVDNAAKALDDHQKADNPHSQYLQMAQLTGVVGTSRNAKMSITAASATATFTADELIVQTSLGGRQYKLTSFNKTINLAITGVGGMDVGAAPTSGYVALYAIYSPSTQLSALLAVNATSALAPQVYAGANMPLGYTASALVSVRGVTSSLFRIGFQSNRHISIPTVGIYSVNVGTTTQTQLSVAPAVPPNAISVDMSITVGETQSGTGVAMSLSSSPSGIGQFGASAVVSGATSSAGETGTLSLIETQRLYFSMSNANTGSYSISCRGYDF